MILSKNIFLILLLFSNIFLSSQTSIKLFKINWGERGSTDKVSYSFGTPIYTPSAMGVDKKGYIYIGDMVNNRVQKYDKNGKFIKTIPNKTENIWDVRRIYIFDNENIYLFSNDTETGILIITQEGDVIYNDIPKFSINVQRQDSSIVKADKVYYFTGSYLNDGTEEEIVYDSKKNKKQKRDYKTRLKNDKIEEIEKIEKEGNSKILNKIHIDDNTEEILTRDISDLRYYNKRLRKDRSNKDDNEDELYKVPIKGSSQYHPILFGYDKDSNSYWYDTSPKDKDTILNIYVYNREGKLLKYFQSIDIGDAQTDTPPTVDIYGNVYSMQPLLKDGLIVWKYERDW